MRATRRISGIIAAAAVALSAATVPVVANAETHHDVYPETPKLNPKLPIVNTTHGSDHIKANILNPHPVCNSGEDYRTVVYKVKDNFTPAGTISTTNKSNTEIPLSQNLSKSQTISITIKGDRTDTTSFNFGGSHSQDGSTGSFGITKTITNQIGASISYSLTWQAGQTIGPYKVPANTTGEATYGFRTIHLDGTQQICRPNGTWSTPTPWRVIAPLKNEVQVKMYSDPADSWLGNTEAAGEVDEDGNEVAKPEVVTDDAAEEVQDGENAEPTTTSDVDEDTDTATEADADEAEAVEAEAAEEPKRESKVEIEDTKQPYDLTPYYKVAAGKAKGFAGLVAVRVKNVGEKRYYQDDMSTRFRIDVHTADGPEGVDRLITPGWFNGAYTRDLGFDPETSTRSFEVTLSNPINAGEDKLIANLNFGDGLTKEGRLKNYITVTQIGRIDGDETTDNDQDVDSRDFTWDHLGRKNAGIF